FQFFSALLTGSVNEPLLKFAKNGSIYIQEVLEFLTFNSEIRPFPFTSWPDEAHTGEDWLDEAPQNSEAVETTAEVVDEALGDDHNKNKSD
ncbi:MAG: hypothetical protein ACI9Z9_002564, partial [Litorivivens sp.]